MCPLLLVSAPPPRYTPPDSSIPILPAGHGTHQWKMTTFIWILYRSRASRIHPHQRREGLYSQSTMSSIRHSWRSWTSFIYILGVSSFAPHTRSLTLHVSNSRAASQTWTFHHVTSTAWPRFITWGLANIQKYKQKQKGKPDPVQWAVCTTFVKFILI